MNDAERQERIRAYLDSMRKEIHDKGWMIQFVAPRRGEDGPVFAYTVGLTPAGLPELLISGMDPDAAAHLLNGAAQLHTRDGEGLEPGRDVVIEGVTMVPLRIVDAPTAELGMARRLYGDAARAVQLLWPNEQGLFPTDNDWPYGPHAQPVFDATYTTPEGRPLMTEPTPTETPEDDGTPDLFHRHWVRRRYVLRDGVHVTRRWRAVDYPLHIGDLGILAEEAQEELAEQLRRNREALVINTDRGVWVVPTASLVGVVVEQVDPDGDLIVPEPGYADVDDAAADLLEYALTYARNGDATAARHTLRAADSAVPNRVRPLVRRALDADAGADLVRAIEAAQKAIDAFAADVAVDVAENLVDDALLEARKGNAEAARQLLREAQSAGLPEQVRLLVQQALDADDDPGLVRASQAALEALYTIREGGGGDADRPDGDGHP